jgi:outer membrane protein OmpA-like peptidoglycan-associated protein
MAAMRMPATALLLGVALGLGPSCASSPKPKELVALEDLRSNPRLSDPDRQAFDLLAAADGLLVLASREWEARNPVAARRDALMGQIKMKTALALLEAERTRARVAQLDEELSISRDEEERLDAQLATAQEETALLERLQAMKLASAAQKKAFSEAVDTAKKQAATERQRLTEQLAADKRKAEALDGIRVLELTLKIAETVDAPHYAKAKYVAASGMLQDAHKEFDAGHWDESAARSTLARAEAESGIALARPQYEKATQAMSNRARDRELEADATSIAGVQTRLERERDLQRLVLVFHGLFGDRQTALRPEGAKLVEAVKDLLEKYPTYPLQLTGFTEGQGKPEELVARSLARANAVFWALVGQGIDPKRLSVDGKGSPRPPADGSSSAHATEDARVELSILYHSTE